MVSYMLIYMYNKVHIKTIKSTIKTWIHIVYIYYVIGASFIAELVKNLPVM